MPAGHQRPARETKETQSASRGLRLLFVSGLAAGFLAALALRLWPAPAGSGWLPALPFSYACPVLSLTGLLCMGCGATRAFGSLLAGDLPAALRQNLLLVPLLAVALWQVLALLLQRLSLPLPLPGRPQLPLIRFSRQTAGVLLAIALGFMVLRNLDLPLSRLLRP